MAGKKTTEKSPKICYSCDHLEVCALEKDIRKGMETLAHFISKTPGGEAEAVIHHRMTEFVNSLIHCDFFKKG